MAFDPCLTQHIAPDMVVIEVEYTFDLSTRRCSTVIGVSRDEPDKIGAFQGDGKKDDNALGQRVIDTLAFLVQRFKTLLVALARQENVALEGSIRSIGHMTPPCRRRQEQGCEQSFVAAFGMMSAVNDVRE